MTRCENHIVPRDEFETAPSRFGDGAVGVKNRERGRCDTSRSKLALDFRPKGQLSCGAIDAASGFVCGVDGGHPDDLATGASCELGGVLIDSANGMVQGDAAEGINSRNGAALNLGMLGGEKV